MATKKTPDEPIIEETPQQEEVPAPKVSVETHIAHVDMNESIRKRIDRSKHSMQYHKEGTGQTMYMFHLFPEE